MTLYIIGLGPGHIDDLTIKALRTLERVPTVFLRTSRHPCVAQLPAAIIWESFDSIYEAHTVYDTIYSTITQRVLEAASLGDVAYAVSADPLVGESTTVRLLAAAREQNLAIEIINGISFIEPMLKHLGIDALDGLQIVDGLTIAEMHHPPLNPDVPSFIAQVYSRDVASNIKITLMNQYPDTFPVTLIHGAGTGEAVVEHVALYEMDRSTQINHLTSMYLPAPDQYTSFEAFQEIIAHLRAPQGCPWDRKQSHESLRRYLLEEAYEVLEAIDNAQWDELAGELGDLLLQIVLHTQIAIDEGEFQMRDVLRHVNTKMIRRHPHVWGDVNVDGDADRVVGNWEEIKKAERADQPKVRESLLDGVPKGLPSLMVAHHYSAKAAKVGFDWATMEGVEDKVREEVQEILTATDDENKIEEIGDLIFVLINWLRWLKVDDPESLVRSTNEKFSRRFRFVERNAPRPLNEMRLEEMDALWNEAKRQGL